MPVVSMKALLEAGVHFGHQTRRWNPKMKPYIFTERNGIYILDLQRTLREIDGAYRFVRNVAAQGRPVLFIGTKKQAQEAIATEAQRAGQPFVNQRWLGGMLTNWVTMRKRISRMVQLENMEADGIFAEMQQSLPEGAHGLARVAPGDDLALVEHGHLVADLSHQVSGVGHEENRPSVPLKLPNAFQALPLEGLVTYGQHLVHHQDLGFHVHRHCESEPDVHAR